MSQINGMIHAYTDINAAVLLLGKVTSFKFCRRIRMVAFFTWQKVLNSLLSSSELQHALSLL